MAIALFGRLTCLVGAGLSLTLGEGTVYGGRDQDLQR